MNTLVYALKKIYLKNTFDLAISIINQICGIKISQLKFIQ